MARAGETGTLTVPDRQTVCEHFPIYCFYDANENYYSIGSCRWSWEIYVVSRAVGHASRATAPRQQKIYWLISVEREMDFKYKFQFCLRVVSIDNVSRSYVFHISFSARARANQRANCQYWRSLMFENEKPKENVDGEKKKKDGAHNRIKMLSRKHKKTRSFKRKITRLLQFMYHYQMMCLYGSDREWESTRAPEQKLQGHIMWQHYGFDLVLYFCV